VCQAPCESGTISQKPQLLQNATKESPLWVKLSKEGDGELHCVMCLKKYEFDYYRENVVNLSNTPARSSLRV
jgi:hypothetical protein